MYDLDFHKKIAQTSLDVFSSLPKTGKPNSKEWTVLSTIVRRQNNCLTVVAMATGSKCIGSGQMSAAGDVLNDSHAEVLCRRAFMRYLYSEMHGESETLKIKDSGFELCDGITFHFFTTHAPCGDASIFCKNDGENVGCAVDNFEVRLESVAGICEANAEQIEVTQFEIGAPQYKLRTIESEASGCAVNKVEVRLGDIENKTTNFETCEIGEVRSETSTKFTKNVNLETKSDSKNLIVDVTKSKSEVGISKNEGKPEENAEFTINKVKDRRIGNAGVKKLVKSKGEVGTNKNEVRNEVKHQHDVEITVDDVEIRLESENSGASEVENAKSGVRNEAKPPKKLEDDACNLKKIKHQLEVKRQDDVKVRLESENSGASEVGKAKSGVRKHQLPNKLEIEASDPKRFKSEVEDIYRTGAKCLPNDAKQDPHEEGAGYHLTGLVRTKPGRGDPTQSVSCSDKIAKWSFLGIQGALLALLLHKPVYLSTFTITSGTVFSHAALKRALHDRLPPVELTGNYRRKIMSVAQVDSTFECAKRQDKRACPSSIIYCYKQKPEVAVEGRKQGVTKKNLKKPSSHLSVHKVELLRAFLRVAKRHNVIPEEYLKCTYGELKGKSEIYRENWGRVKGAFKIWTCKDGTLLDFSVSL